MRVSRRILPARSATARSTLSSRKELNSRWIVAVSKVPANNSQRVTTE